MVSPTLESVAQQLTELQSLVQTQGTTINGLNGSTNDLSRLIQLNAPVPVPPTASTASTAQNVTNNTTNNVAPTYLTTPITVIAFVGNVDYVGWTTFSFAGGLIPTGVSAVIVEGRGVWAAVANPPGQINTRPNSSFSAIQTLSWEQNVAANVCFQTTVFADSTANAFDYRITDGIGSTTGTALDPFGLFIVGYFA